MSSNNTAQNTSTTLKSVDVDSLKKEQLKKTARVFTEACNQIVRSYMRYYKDSFIQSLDISVTEKILEKLKLQFSQFVITLVYLKRYYEACAQFKRHIPGHEEAEIPSLTHVVILCIIQAESYITDVPRKLSWWSSICLGQSNASELSKWQRSFLTTINYNLYIHPERDFEVYKDQIQNLASRLFSRSAKMPPQFRRSVYLGTQVVQNQSERIPSQPNIIRTETNTVSQPRVLLSPHYSGHENVNSNVSQPQRVALVTSPVASTHNSLIDNQHSQTNNLNVPVLNITNTNLTTSPLNIEGSMINQTRSPSSIYISSESNGNQLQTNNLILPIQNPNHLMVQSNHRQIPNRSNTTETDMINIESQEIRKVIRPRPIKRKRSYYDMSKLSKIVNDFKKAKIMTISPEELGNQPKASNTTRPMKENENNTSIPSIVLMNQKVVESPSIISLQSKDSSTSNQEDNYRIQGDEQENESETSSQSFRRSELLNIENSEVLPSTSNETTLETLGSNENTNNGEIIYTSLLSNNSITIIPVSPPLTPQ